MFRIERATPQTATQLRTQQAVQEPLLPFIYRLRHANAVQLATTLNVYVPLIKRWPIRSDTYALRTTIIKGGAAVELLVREIDLAALIEVFF